MNKSKAIEILRRQIEPIGNLKSKEQGQEFNKWHRDTEIAIEQIFDKESRHINDFKDISYSLCAFTSSTPDYAFHKAYQDGLDTAKTVLLSFIDEIDQYWTEEELVREIAEMTTGAKVKIICNNFHKVVRQLRSRHDNRGTLEIDDEYDVQDLFHALLRLYYEDIRDEEWTPSYAGACSRVDFLLKQEQTIIEIKKTRKGLSAKEVGDQLLIDIQRYKAHPDCKSLICFVYDPEGRIGNPAGIENDLNREVDGLAVNVFIEPKNI